MTMKFLCISALDVLLFYRGNYKSLCIMTKAIWLSQILSYREGEHEVVSFLEEHLNIKSDSEPQPGTGEYLLLHYVIFSYAT